jgi:predicted nuclease of restriction endonuclease-like RecB superfamily
VLTADHVVARRRGGELIVRALGEDDRAEALRLAVAAIPIFRAAVGHTRDDLETELASVETEPRHQKVRDGLIKLLEDRCTWGVETGPEPADVRREVFTRSAKARAALEAGARFDRAAVLTEAAGALGLDVVSVDRALYADLRGANVLSVFETVSPAALVEAYARGQVQAVLLRAARVKVGIACDSPAAARNLFRRLKFLGLLYTMQRTDRGYELAIDGPLSLFESVTKYGHRIAQLTPLLEACGPWNLEADLRWGKERVPLTFRARGGASSSNARGADGESSDETAVPDDLADLVRAFRALGTPWRVSKSRTVLDLPGTGLCVPDLVFTREKQSIYFEALGYWSREAVFRRVDLVERGISETILFAASSKLRVSEELLGDDVPAALYVHKGTIKARAIVEHLERLATRATPRAKPANRRVPRA